VTAYLLPLLLLWPLLGALLVALLGRQKKLRDGLVLSVTGLTLLGALALLWLVSSERLQVSVPLLLGLTLSVDAFSALMALFAAFVWFCVSLYATDYWPQDSGSLFHATSLLVLSAMLGIVLAGDLVTLYLFFEILGLLGFILVIHDGTHAARRAGLKYLWMTMPGSAALLAGILLVYNLSGAVAIDPLSLEAGATRLHWLAFGLLLLGFGVKAGMVPVHAWLPGAHTAAPSPASALLSGVMINAGAYGIFRAITAIFRPDLGHDLVEVWQQSTSFGLIVLWLGLVTMLFGVIMALRQHNAKRLLAYSSISQMGFVLAGLGAAGYLGQGGAQGLAGGLLHLINHGLLKAALFLGVGAVVFRTREYSLYKLGGLWRQMPLTFIFMLFAAAGIAGIPLFGGFVSKSLISHALLEAHPLWPWRFSELLFIITGGGTVALFIKLIGLTFFGKPKHAMVRDATPRMLFGIGFLVLGTIAVGLWPQPVLGTLAAGMSTWGLSTTGVETFLQQYFLGASDLYKAGLTTAIGILIYLMVVKTGLLSWRWAIPKRLRSVVSSLLTPAARGAAVTQHSRRAIRALSKLKLLPGLSLLTRLEKLLMRWDHAGALWLVLGALLTLVLLTGGIGV